MYIVFIVIGGEIPLFITPRLLLVVVPLLFIACYFIYIACYYSYLFVVFIYCYCIYLFVVICVSHCIVLCALLFVYCVFCIYSCDYYYYGGCDYSFIVYICFLLRITRLFVFLHMTFYTLTSRLAFSRFACLDIIDRSRLRHFQYCAFTVALLILLPFHSTSGLLVQLVILFGQIHSFCAFKERRRASR